MTPLDRFTRDRLSPLLWAGLAVAFAILIAFAASGSRRDLVSIEGRAQKRAEGYTASTLFRNLDVRLMSKPILGPAYRALLIPVQAEIMTDPTVARLRIWNVDGSLVFSTDERESIGQAQASGVPGIRTALGGETTSSVGRGAITVESGIRPPTEQLYQSYVPLHVPDQTPVVGVVEVDFHLAPMVAASAGSWRALETVFGLGFLLCLGLFAMSLRPSRQRDEDEASIAPSAAAVETVAGSIAATPALRPPPDDGLRDLQDRLMREQMRRAEAERTARQAESVAELHAAERARDLEMEIRRLRERLELDGSAPGDAHPDEVDEDVGAIRLELDAVRRELEAVRAEVDAARSEREVARAETERALDELAAATDGASGAEEGDLSDRLARSAARRKRASDPVEPAS